GRQARARASPSSAPRTGSSSRSRPSPAEGCGLGRLFAGTSGRAYPGSVARFYPAALPAKGFLGHYAERLPAVELNNTYYASPKAPKVEAGGGAPPAEVR